MKVDGGRLTIYKGPGVRGPGNRGSGTQLLLEFSFFEEQFGDGRVEEWKIGRRKRWNVRTWEDWKDGRVEEWKEGVEDGLYFHFVRISSLWNVAMAI